MSHNSDPTTTKTKVNKKNTNGNDFEVGTWEKAPHSLIRDPNLHPSLKILWLELKSHCFGKDWCVVSTAALAANLQRTTRHTYDAINALESAGYLYIDDSTPHKRKYHPIIPGALCEENRHNIVKKTVTNNQADQHTKDCEENRHNCTNTTNNINDCEVNRHKLTPAIPCEENRHKLCSKPSQVVKKTVTLTPDLPASTAAHSRPSDSYQTLIRQEQEKKRKEQRSTTTVEVSGPTISHPTTSGPEASIFSEYASLSNPNPNPNPNPEPKTDTPPSPYQRKWQFSEEVLQRRAIRESRATIDKWARAYIHSYIDQTFGDDPNIDAFKSSICRGFDFREIFDEQAKGKTTVDEIYEAIKAHVQPAVDSVYHEGVWLKAYERKRAIQPSHYHQRIA